MYNVGPNFDPNNPFSQTWNSVPVPGISSGMLASGMNFDYLPPQTPIVTFQPPPSPLQQRVAIGGDPPSSPFSVGSPVRIVHMQPGESAVYNGLIGDVVAVDYVEKDNGTQAMVFDIRCPLDHTGSWVQALSLDAQTHARVQPSQFAMQMANQNVKCLGRDSSVYRENGGGPPPYLLLKKFPSEKLEPFGPGSESHGVRRPGPPGVEMMPVQTIPGIMGPPTQPVPEGARPLPLDPMSMGLGMRQDFGPPGSMVPPQSMMGGPPGSMGAMGMPPGMPFMGGPPPGSMPMGSMNMPPNPFGSMPPGTMPMGQPPMGSFGAPPGSFV